MWALSSAGISRSAAEIPDVGCPCAGCSGIRDGACCIGANCGVAYAEICRWYRKDINIEGVAVGADPFGVSINNRMRAYAGSSRIKNSGCGISNAGSAPNSGSAAAATGS